MTVVAPNDLGQDSCGDEETKVRIVRSHLIEKAHSAAFKCISMGDCECRCCCAVTVVLVAESMSAVAGAMALDGDPRLLNEIEQFIERIEKDYKEIFEKGT